VQYEKKLLIYLVENYRKSKKDLGENKTNRRTQVKPEKLYKKYNSNDGDFEEIEELNYTVEILSKKGFISYSVETFGTQIKGIYLVDEKIVEIENYLNQKYEYISKDMQLKKLNTLISTYQNASLICTKECERLSEYVKKRKIPKDLDELEDVLKAISFIEKNQEDLWIREVSMKVYGDSKFFEEKTLTSVCTLLRKYSKEKNDTESELLDEILLTYHILKEPQKLCMKGAMILTILGKEVDISGLSEGIEIMASDLKNIDAIKILSPRFLTIENKTSYLRYQDQDTTTFYLGGYANRYQRDFLKLVYHGNPYIEYLHFGDIDAGGFWIHDNLCEITGINFLLFHMSVEELKNSKYSMCLHPLTDRDRIRLQELKTRELYTTTITYMLENNVKLEQEIVSLELSHKSI
jgi:hypothetical protein